MYLLLAGNDTVPISIWRAKGMRSTGLLFCFTFVMVALCNRADHYIFMLWFVLLLSSSFFLFFPRLISAVGDWMFTILWHMVWP